MSNDRYQAAKAIRERCRKDPIFWAFRYVKTRDEHDKTNPVKPLPRLDYLKTILHEFHAGPRLIYVAKSRQLMISWLLSIYGLHTIIFEPMRLVLFQSKKEEDAARMIYLKSALQARMSFVYSNLPKWLQGCYDAKGEWIDCPADELFNTKASAGHIVLPNGSEAEALAQGASQVESRVPSLFLNDEASLQEEWASSQAAAQPAIDKDSKGITVGTMRMPSDYGDEIEPSWYCQPDSVMRGIGRFTSESGVYGLRVHYSADPGKDPQTPEGQLWKQEQLSSGAYRGGEMGWRWQQHMEINPEARSGTLVIPVMRDKSAMDKIVVEPVPIPQMHNWAFDAGLDWGSQNHAVWLIFGIDPRGYRYLVHELSAPGKELGGVVGMCRAMHAHPLFKRVNGRIQADPSIWKADQATQAGMTSIATLFAHYGVYLQPAAAKGQAADDIFLDRLLYYYWEGWHEADFDPLLKIFKTCTNTLRTWPTLVYEEYSEALAPKKGLKEKIRDKDVDQFDAAKYAEVYWTDVPSYRAPAAEGTFQWHKNRYEATLNRTGGDVFLSLKDQKRPVSTNPKGNFGI